MRFSFIHTGDLHLDSPLTGLSGLDDERALAVASASRRAFRDLTDAAIARGVDAVLVAGDLWDGDWSDVSVGFFVEEEAARLSEHGVKVFAVLGNHDAASQITDRVRRIGAMTIFPDDAPASAECGAAVIHGMSYARRDTTENLAARYPAAVPGRINIGLLHTALEGAAGEHARYAPTTLSELSAKAYHYWALGHVHTRACLQSEGAARGGTVAYCGVLQGRHARETGRKGAYHGVVEGGEVRLTELDFGHVAWHARTVSLAAGQSEEEALRGALADVASENHAALGVVRLTLAGETERHFALASRGRELLESARWAAARAGAGRLLVERVVLATRPPSGQEAARLPSRFEAMLMRAARDPVVAERAAAEIADVLNVAPPAVRNALAERMAELDAFERTGAVGELLEASANALAARLADKIGS